jgi:hypothetical protein
MKNLFPEINVNRFKLDVSRKTGFTTLWMATNESPCGYTPLIGWSNIQGLKEFAEMLLDMYRHSLRESERVKKASDCILQDVFGNKKFSEGYKNV